MGLIGVVIVVVIRNWRRDGFLKLGTKDGLTPIVVLSTAFVMVGVVPGGLVRNSSRASAFVIFGS